MASLSEATGLSQAGTEPGWIAALAGRRADFVSDRRFATEQDAAPPGLPSGINTPSVQADPWQLGYEVGVAAGKAEEQRRTRAEDDTRDKLRLAFTRLDERARRVLAEQLAETVADLCEEAMAPLVLDTRALQQRCETAAAALGGASERLTLRLNPADLPLLDTEFASAWTVIADADLARGALSLEGADGGIADDPAIWLAQLRQALRAC